MQNTEQGRGLCLASECAERERERGGREKEGARGGGRREKGGGEGERTARGGGVKS